MSEWGRVTEDGTVFVRTADGEREVGSWKAGSPEEGLAHFTRRYEQLATEVTLLEQRLASGVGDPNQIAQSAQRLKAALPTAAAVGDLAALERRVDALLERTAGAVEAARAARAEQRAEAVARKTALAEEAEQLGGSSDWKAAGERLRSLGDDWKKISGVDKRTDDELWQRVAAARKRFNERRTTHFAALEQQREVSRSRKEALIAQAEQLSTSTDWRGTADRYRQLMTDWKAAGRAPREVEDDLWTRFKGAQDAFFAARSASYAEQDAALRGNQQVKEEILAEAEALDPAQGKEHTRRLRQLQERWEAAGKVPRDVMRSLEDRMGKVEEKFRRQSDVRSAASESPFVVRLREKVAELEVKLEKARAAERPTDELEAQLATQRQWLAQAGAATAGPSREPAGPRKPRSTSAWVRADG
ncbi:MAG: DUF349 domain-containing protein [Actinomycetota bacterium]|nr:DUF349 domain-containing protein [Actinomycetota bacterium]